MCFLCLRSYKRLLMMSTTVRFFSGVNSCMSLQFVWRSKNHATMSTQIKSFSPVWTFECRLKADRPLKDFLHNVQMNGFSPVWTLICVFRWLEAENDFLQWGQLKGLSHVWTLVCFLCPANIYRTFCIKNNWKVSPVWTLECLLHLWRNSHTTQQLNSFTLYEFLNVLSDG